MGWPKCNNTAELERISEVDVWHGLTFHQLGLLLSAITGLISIVVSLYLIMMHATHYLRPWEQRHIIRILFMVPIYSTVSFLSYLHYTRAVYFETIRDCYEAIAIASFFTLLCHYIAEDLHQQKNYFRSIKPRNWLWPISWLQKCIGGKDGPLRTPRSGLTWFNVIWVGVFQYCFVRVFFTCVAEVTQAFNLYCQNSLNPAFSHIWVMGFEAVAVTIAMYCIIQFYLQIKKDIAQHKPLLKVTAIKLVIFLSFWQSLLISFLTSTGVIKSGPRFGTPDIKIGIPSMLLDIEMAIFSVFHLWAFSWLPYRLNSKLTMTESVPGHSATQADYKGGFLGYKAIIEAFNPWDLVKAVGRSARWLVVGRRHRTLDSSYNRTRQGTDSSINMGPNGGLGQENTAYQPGKSAQMGDEGQELLTHAQSNPNGPPPAYNYNNHPIYDNYTGHGEIGVARSTYGGDDDSDERSFDQRSYESRGHSPIPPPPSAPTANTAGYPQSGRQRETNMTTQPQQTYNLYPSQRPQYDSAPADVGTAVPYPDAGSYGGRQNRISMPHAPDPGPFENRGRRQR